PCVTDTSEPATNTPIAATSDHTERGDSSRPAETLEERRRPCGDWLWKRLYLRHPGADVVVEPAGKLERGDGVRRVDEHGRGAPLAQPAGHRGKPGLPARDRARVVVPADVADDRVGGKCLRPAGQPRLVRPCLPFGIARGRAPEQHGGVEGHPFGADGTERPLAELLRSPPGEEPPAAHLHP